MSISCIKGLSESILGVIYSGSHRANDRIAELTGWVIMSYGQSYCNLVTLMFVGCKLGNYRILPLCGARSSCRNVLPHCRGEPVYD